MYTENYGNFRFADSPTWTPLVTNKNKMNILEKYVMENTTPESKKVFRKAGIVNGDSLLTENGTEIFLAWLLNKYAEEFKAEVVDSLLKKEEN